MPRLRRLDIGNRRDYLFKHVSFLASGVGSDGITSIVDASYSKLTCSASGDAKVNRGSFLFDGSGDYFSVPDNVAFDFGTNPFTWEFEINASNLGASPFAIHQLNGSAAIDTGWFIEMALGQLYAGYGTFTDPKTFDTFVSSDLVNSRFVHIALCRNGNAIQVFVNGKLTKTFNSTAGGSSYNKTTSFVFGGGRPYLTAYDLQGRMRSVRLTKALRYTRNFTPPKWPLPTIP